MDLTGTHPDTTLYIGNIDSKVTKELLYELFIQISPLSRIRYPRDKVLQSHQGFAFIEFYTPEDAEYVAKCMNNTVRLYDRTLKVRKANVGNPSGQQVVDIGAKLFVKDLDELVDSAMLSKLFSKIGTLARPPEIFFLKQGQLKCAYIYYTTFEHSDRALEKLNNQMVMNKCISIDYALKEGKKNEKHGDKVERLLEQEARKHAIIST